MVIWMDLINLTLDGPVYKAVARRAAETIGIGEAKINISKQLLFNLRNQFIKLCLSEPPETISNGETKLNISKIKFDDLRNQFIKLEFI